MIVGCTKRQKGDVGGDAGEVLMALIHQVVKNHGPVTVRNPFIIADLMSWRKVARAYKEDPVRVAKAFETIIRSQDPLTRKQLAEYFNNWWLKYILVICKERGHWKRECPQGRRNQTNTKPNSSSHQAQDLK